MSKVALIGCSNYELYEVKKLFGEVFLILVELKKGIFRNKNRILLQPNLLL